MFHLSSYQDILREELEKRCSANPSYSLRAFARDLKIHPSRLSETLNRKQGLSATSAQKIAQGLNISGDQRSYFVNLVVATDSRSKKTRERAQKLTQQIRAHSTRASILDVDSFRVISDWYHFAIMELSTTRDFSSDPAWIAQRLGLSVFEVQGAIERLLRLGLMEWHKKTLRQCIASLNTPNDIASDAIKNFHEQVIKKALVALRTQPPELREFGSQMVSIPKKRVPQFKQLIRKFREDFGNLVNPQDKPEEVYNLSLQFFKLTEERK